MSTTTTLKRRILSTARWLSVLFDGLSGKPHDLGAGEGDAFFASMQRQGVQLLSRTRIADVGLQLKRGAKPVVRIYLRAPIARHIDFFVLEQTRPNPQPECP